MFLPANDVSVCQELHTLGCSLGRGLDDALLDYERQLIQAKLERSGGVLAKAARSFGVDRTTVSKRCN